MDHVCESVREMRLDAIIYSTGLPPQFPLRDHYDVVQFRHA